MKRLCFILFMFCLYGVKFANAYPEVYDDVFIEENDVINSNIIVAIQDVYIHNDGIINGNIDNNGNNIIIQNSGTINGYVYNNDYGSVKQIITKETELKPLNIVNNNTDKFIISVENFNGVNFTSIANLNAPKYVFKNSSIVINNFQDWNNWNKNVLFDGNDNKLYITNSYTVQSGTYIRHTNSLTNIEVIIQDSDNLHKASWVNTMDGIVLNIVRETDYEKIFNDKRGVLLKNIEIKNPDSKFLRAMNMANNMHELKSVMDSSYNFNHKILLEPLHILNNFHMMNFYHESNDFEFGLNPFYIGGNNLSAFGGRAYVADKYKDVLFNLGLNFTKFNYQDSINEFSGLVFGADFQVKTNIFEQYWIRALSGFNIVKYMADNIYVDDDIKNNPNGRSLYLSGDMGYDFKMDDNFVIAPFVGINLQNNSVYKTTEFDSNLRAGCDLKYGFDFDGIKYNYGALISGGVNGDLFGELKFGFDSLEDRAGASFNIGVFNNQDFGLNYKFGVDAKVVF